MSEYIRQLCSESDRQAAEDAAQDKEVMIRIANAGQRTGVLSAPADFKCDRRLSVEWKVAGHTIVSENDDGTYYIHDWHQVTVADIERLYFTLGQLLLDLEACQVKGGD